MDVTVTCPKCSESLEADESLCGDAAICPCCEEPIVVPAKPAPSDTTHRGRHLVVRQRDGSVRRNKRLDRAVLSGQPRIVTPRTWA